MPMPQCRGRAVWASKTSAAGWPPCSAARRAWKHTPRRSGSASSSICRAPPMSDAAVPPLKVAIVDDEELARAMVREYLAAVADVEIVAECSNGFEAVKVVSDLRPHLLILLVQMTMLDGVESLELAGREGSG